MQISLVSPCWVIFTCPSNFSVTMGEQVIVKFHHCNATKNKFRSNFQSWWVGGFATLFTSLFTYIFIYVFILYITFWGQAIRELQYSHFKKSLLASVSDDGAVNLWDTNTRRHLHSFGTMHQAPATGVAFSPLNEMLLMTVGLDKKIICYDVQGKM